MNTLRGAVRRVKERPADQAWGLDDIVNAVAKVATAILESGPMEVCEACGCLCLPFETCPGCLARMHAREGAAA